MAIEKLGQKVIKNLNVPDRKVAEKVNEVIDSGGGEITVDPSLNPESTNPVENRQIYNKFVETDTNVQNHGSAITQLQNETTRLNSQKEDRFDVRSPVRKSGNMLTVDVTDEILPSSALPISSQQIYGFQQGVIQDLGALGNEITNLESRVVMKNSSTAQRINSKIEIENNQGIIYNDAGNNVLGLEMKNSRLITGQWVNCINFFSQNILIGRIISGTQTDGSSYITLMVRNRDGSDKYVELAQGDR